MGINYFNELKNEPRKGALIKSFLFFFFAPHTPGEEHHDKHSNTQKLSE